MREQEGKQEHDREDRRDDADVLDLARAQLDDGIRDEARRDTVGDRIGEAHHRNGEEGRNGRSRVLPIDARNVAHHQHTDIHQSARRRAGRDELCDGAEEHGDRKQNRNDERRETRSAAFRNARGGLDEGRDRGSTQDRARAGSDRVAQESLLDVFDLARIVEQAALLACRLAGAHQRADRIEHIDHRKGDERGDKVEDLIGGYPLEAVDEYLPRRLCTEIGKSLQGIGEGDAVKHRNAVGRAHCRADAHKGIIQHRTADDADDHSRLDFQLGKNGDHQQGKNRDDRGDHRLPADGKDAQIEGNQPDFRAGIRLHDDSGVLHTDERDEQADARGDRDADRRRNGADDHFARADNREDEEQNARTKDDEESIRIGISQPFAANGKYEKRIQPHAGRLRKRNFCEKRHQERTDDRTQRRKDIRRAECEPAATDIDEHIRVCHEDVDHRHERRKSRQHLRLEGRLHLRDAEVVVDLAEEAGVLRLCYRFPSDRFRRGLFRLRFFDLRFFDVLIFCHLKPPKMC